MAPLDPALHTRVLTVVTPAGGASAALAEKAPGGAGSPLRREGSKWSVSERSIASDAIPDLVEYLEGAASSERADWAVTPVDNRRKRLLISDMDSTVIGQECLDELADFAGLKAEVSAITERAMRGELNFEEALTTRVAMLRGLAVSALEACYRERITLNAGTRTLVGTMKANGARCVLVSGGFTFFTSRVAAAAGFHADRANTLIETGTSLTGEVGRPILGREAKLSALVEETAALGGSPSDAVAMGDGANDLDMIRAAGLGVAYKAKPIVARETLARIQHTDLTAALFFQGYGEDELVEG